MAFAINVVIEVHPTEAAARAAAANMRVARQLSVDVFGEVSGLALWDNRVNDIQDTARKIPAGPIWIVIGKR